MPARRRPTHPWTDARRFTDGTIGTVAFGRDVIRTRASGRGAADHRADGQVQLGNVRFGKPRAPQHTCRHAQAVQMSGCDGNQHKGVTLTNTEE
eukprot:5196896-Pyramimonas_sp.AAC.1